MSTYEKLDAALDLIGREERRLREAMDAAGIPGARCKIWKAETHVMLTLISSIRCFDSRRFAVSSIGGAYDESWIATTINKAAAYLRAKENSIRRNA